MRLTIKMRLEDYADMEPRILHTSGSAIELLAWLQGFLCEGVIVDSLKVEK